MNQAELNRAVAQATGETVSTVKRLGFLIADPTDSIGDPNDPQLGGNVFDWDDVDLLGREQERESLDALSSC